MSLNIWKMFCGGKCEINKLPKEHQLAHDLSFFLHDILVQIIKSGEDAEIFASRFKIDSPKDLEAFSLLSGDELWVWLEENNYQYVLDDLVLRQATVALLSDFCHFVYEALKCSKKLKLTVAFALLRKPLKDNLFYLEWLFVNRPEFLKMFKDGLSEPTTDVRRGVIKLAVDSIATPRLYDSDLIYDFRYKKSANFGFEGNWNKANHLITTFRDFKTEAQNFNFVFSGEKERETQLRFLYTRLPYLLNYVVEVLESLLGDIEKTDPAYVESMRLRRLAGLAIWAQSLDPVHCGWDIEKFSEKLKEYLKIECPKCSQVYYPDLKLMGILYEGGKMRCPLCGGVSRLPLKSVKLVP